MRQIIALAMVCTVLTGCTGSFELTRKVYDFHRSQENKWMDELIFLGVVILPVYSIATLGDAVIFNTIEFWSGENPLQQVQAIEEGGAHALLSANPDNTLTIETAAGALILEKTDAGVLARDANGEILYKAVADGKGGVDVYGRDDATRHFSAAQVDGYKERFARN